MRRPKKALAWLTAVLVTALSASFLKAQMFGRRPSAPPGPSSEPAATAYTPPQVNRGARQLLRNGLDYLKNYNDPERAARYLEEADARRNELTADEQKSLDAALETTQTRLAGRAPALEDSASLPPRPETALAAQSSGSSPSLPPLPVLDPVPGPGFGPEPGVVRTSGEAEPAPASSAEEAPEQKPEPEGEPIGLTVLSNPADQLVGLEPAGSSADAMPAAELPAQAMPEGAPEAGDLLLSGQGAEGPASAPALEEAPPEPAPAPAPEEAAPPALDALPEPASEAPPALDASAPPALPALPGPAFQEAGPLAEEPLPLEAPDARNQAEAPAGAMVPPVLPPDSALPALPGPGPDPIASPAPGTLPEDSGQILAPPEMASAPGLAAEPALPVDAGPAPEGLDAPPLELGAPALAELPEPAPVADPSPVPRPLDASAPTAVEPPPAPEASELLPGIDLSAAQPGAPSASDNSAPIADPAPIAQTVPTADPAPIAQPAAPPVSPPPAEAPPARPAQHTLLLNPETAGAPIPQGTATLSPETLREVQEIAQRQAEDMQNGTNPYAGIPLPMPTPGGGRLGPTPGNTADVSGGPAELPRAPSPTEARPIRPIPVPEETVQLPAREFEPNRKYWAAPALCTMPLYFQDAVLERYGQNVEQAMGPIGRFFSYPIDDPRQSNQRIQILQPFYSAGMFALQVGALPYNLVVDPPWESHYQLGYFRPGDPTPPDLYYLPTTGLGPPLHGKRYGRPYDNK